MVRLNLQLFAEICRERFCVLLFAVAGEDEGNMISALDGHADDGQDAVGVNGCVVLYQTNGRR